MPCAPAQFTHRGRSYEGRQTRRLASSTSLHGRQPLATARDAANGARPQSLPPRLRSRLVTCAHRAPRRAWQETRWSRHGIASVARRDAGSHDRVRPVWRILAPRSLAPSAAPRRTQPQRRAVTFAPLSHSTCVSSLGVRLTKPRDVRSRQTRLFGSTPPPVLQSRRMRAVHDTDSRLPIGTDSVHIDIAF